ncbi:hypothetical protein RO3G_14145 [Rhizopus delemar RA 99-880]|uniref:Uncharacterized protein n=1 Tax=Rhizopus delemar (strain RA 99-880 / ATCC MYA-4621 / FGSC 9543 / NRRL 43880) TaxID=246409 RepID=I1CLV4_RHIO9|nr:hypothetical protein RO3G_14145 [Rhizopus delemar RA 99-880]|eukprot:EIE89434.1 hypothetical protein RO3G_14145 [Rhizopus delemar RA 99-880]
MIIITKDLFQPATAKISFKDLKKIGQSPGSWVEVYSEQGKVKIFGQPKFQITTFLQIVLFQ